MPFFTPDPNDITGVRTAMGSDPSLREIAERAQSEQQAMGAAFVVLIFCAVVGVLLGIKFWDRIIDRSKSLAVEASARALHSSKSISAGMAVRATEFKKAVEKREREIDEEKTPSTD